LCLCARRFRYLSLSAVDAVVCRVAWETIKYADMHAKGISLLYQYEEGNDLDFNIGLYFYEKLCRFLEDPKNSRWTSEEFAISQPEMMTAIKRKQELREKVDVNFDGRISFLEYLLHQYERFANPADFCVRSMVCKPAVPFRSVPPLAPTTNQPTTRLDVVRIID